MTPKILTDLQKDLQLEYAAAVQYTQHYGQITGPEYMQIRSQFGDHAKQEMDHALKLSDLIAYYGGTPTAEVGKIATGKDAITMLKQNAVAEDMAITRYRQRIQDVEKEGMYELGTVLRGILEDELDHANDIKLALGK